MSFISLLEHVGNIVRIGAKATQAIAPIVDLVPYGQLIVATAAGLESAIPETNFGPAKRAATMAMVMREYPNANPQKVGMVTDKIIAILNQQSEDTP